jgi:hypothetical protein
VLRTPEGPTLEALNRDLSDLGSWDDTIYVVPDTSHLITHQGEASTDLRSKAFQDKERQRIRHVLSAFGEVQREFRLDRRRIFLDCTRGTAAFGLRLATYFPSRFAGVILRGPFPVGGDVLLESLAGVRVLMECAVGNQVCIHLQRRLDALQPGNVTIVEAYNRASRVQIDTWLRAVKRPLFPPRVLLAPNNASFRKSHWVEIVTAEDPLLVPADQRPLVIAHADHEANRITIRARGVTEVGLYLNDHLIDLDRDPELIVNGVRIGPLQLQRSLRTVERYMRRAYDPTALYTAYHRVIIPRRVVSMRLTTFEPRQIARHGSSSPTPEFVPGGGRKSGTIAPRPNPMRRPVRASRPPAQGGRDEPDWTEPEEVVSKRVVAKPAAELEPTTKSGRGRWYAFQVGIPDLLPWLSVLCILAMVAVLWIARRGQASG